MSSDPNLIRILTVDDHPLLRKGIAALVNTENDMKLVAEASSGEEAIEKFRAHRPDVTLMDIQLPGLNGIETLTQIQKEFPNARIIVLTTYSGDVQVVRAMKAGAGTEVQLAIAASIAYRKTSGRSRFRLFQRNGNHEHRP